MPSFVSLSPAQGQARLLMYGSLCCSVVQLEELFVLIMRVYQDAQIKIAPLRAQKRQNQAWIDPLCLSHEPCLMRGDGAGGTILQGDPSKHYNPSVVLDIMFRYPALAVGN